MFNICKFTSVIVVCSAEVASCSHQHTYETLSNRQSSREMQLNRRLHDSYSKSLSTPNLSSNNASKSTTPKCTLYYARPIILTDFSSSSPELRTSTAPMEATTLPRVYQRRFIPLAAKRNKGNDGSSSHRVPLLRSSYKAVLLKKVESSDLLNKSRVWKQNNNASVGQLSDADAQSQKPSDREIQLRRTNRSFRKAVDCSYDDDALYGFNDACKSVEEKKSSVKKKIIQRLHRLAKSPLKHSLSLENSNITSTSTQEEKFISLSNDLWTLPNIAAKDYATDPSIERIYSSAESRVLAWQARNTAAVHSHDEANVSMPLESNQNFSCFERSYNHYNSVTSRAASIW